MTLVVVGQTGLIGNGLIRKNCHDYIDFTIRNWNLKSFQNVFKDLIIDLKLLIWVKLLTTSSTSWSITSFGEELFETPAAQTISSEFFTESFNKLFLNTF